MPPAQETRLQAAAGGFASGRVFVPHPPGPGGPILEPDRGRPIDVGLTEEARARQQALDAISAKAGEPGINAGAPAGPLTAVPGGYMRAYEGCDIYFGPDTGAHEIHGDIRAKYNARHGVYWLGLPVSDETRAPDEDGRYNHFQRGSIYWTSHTGPMIVAGAVRERWATDGWERGPLGYPVADEHRVSGLRTGDTPNVAWSMFENGVIVSTNAGTDIALFATLSPEDLRVVVRRQVDVEIHRSPDNIGLHAPVETLGVSGWSYGFWGALPRVITLRLHGFRDMGLAADTDFDLDLSLRIGTAPPPSFTEPAHRSIIAALDGIRVRAEGIASGSVAQGVYDGVRRAFFRGHPDPDHPEVPDGALFVASFATGISQAGSGNVDVVDAFVSEDGGLRVCVNPLPRPVGELRRARVQDAINQLVAG